MILPMDSGEANYRKKSGGGPRRMGSLQQSGLVLRAMSNSR